MSKLAKKSANIFSHSSILISKPNRTLSDTIRKWTKLTLYFEDRTISRGYLSFELAPKMVEYFQTGLCVGSFGHMAKNLQSTRKHWTHEYIVGGMLGRKTEDYYISSDIVDEKPCSNISANILQYALSKYIGQVEQFYPPRLIELLNLEDDDEDSDEVSEKKFVRKLQQKSSPGFMGKLANCYSIELLDFDRPYFKLRIRCDGLFKCRAMINDLGEHLGCYSTMTSLHLQRLGPFEYGKDPALEKHQIYLEQIKENAQLTTERCTEYLKYLKQIYPRSKDRVRFI